MLLIRFKISGKYNCLQSRMLNLSLVPCSADSCLLPGFNCGMLFVTRSMILWRQNVALCRPRVETFGCCVAVVIAACGYIQIR